MNERWLPVVGHESTHEVSDQGRARSIDYRDARGHKHRGRTLKGKRCQDRLQIALPGGRYRYLHVLILEAFRGPCPEGQEGCHTNGDPMDNTLTNLRWDTHRNNLLDMVRHQRNSAGKRFCPQNHPLSEPNLVAYFARRGRRSCLACSRARAAIHHAGSGDLQVISDLYFEKIGVQS